MDELMQKFHPKAGVTYTALALNEKGVERARQYSPTLTIERGSGRPTLRVHICDVFARRNTNRTQMQEMAVWPHVITKAKAQGATPSLALAIANTLLAWGMVASATLSTSEPGTLLAGA